MEAIDFSRSFVTFVTPGRTNNARIQVECRCTLTEGDGAPQEYLLVASCKSENTYADDDLFKVPNYDFCGVFQRPDGADLAGAEYTIIRTHAAAGVEPDETGAVGDRFDDLVVHLVTTDQARVCGSKGEVVQATLAGTPLVGRTALLDRDTGRRAVLEYPIRTMNANDIDTIYQVDTGPVVFPDLASPVERRIESLRLAFVVFSSPERAEFALLAPTPVRCKCGDDVLVSHYSQVVKVAAKNEVIAAA